MNILFYRRERVRLTNFRAVIYGI